MSDMNSLGSALADMGDNLLKLRTNLTNSLEQLNREREVMIKNINDHYTLVGQMLVDFTRDVEKLQGVQHIEEIPDPNFRRYGDTV